MTRRIFIDKQSPKAYHALVQTSEAVRATAADAGLERSVVELINLRVSQLNGCAFCLDVHTRAALRAGEDTRRLGVLAAWRDTELFTPLERAALALAEATTVPCDAATQESAYADARRAHGRPGLGGDLGGRHHQRLQPGVHPQQAPSALSDGGRPAVAPRRVR